MPLVLPLSEEQQFEALLSRGIKKEIIDEEVDSLEQLQPELTATSTNGDLKTKKPNRRRIESDSEEEADGLGESKCEMLKFKPSSEPIVASSQKVASLLLKLEQEPSDDLLLLQLPSTLLSLSNKPDEGTDGADLKPPLTTNVTTNVTTKEHVDIKKEISLEPGATAAGAPDATGNMGHCLDQFENGTQLGKLRIRKSGRVELSVGGMFLDVTCGIEAGHTESVVLIETSTQQPPQMPPIAQHQSTTLPFPIKSEPIEADMEQEQPPDNLYVIGRVAKSLVCSHNFAQAIATAKLARQQQKELSEKDQKPAELVAKVNESEAAEVKKLHDDLESMELREKSWVKWVANYGPQHSTASDSMELDDSS